MFSHCLISLIREQNHSLAGRFGGGAFLHYVEFGGKAVRNQGHQKSGVLIVGGGWACCRREKMCKSAPLNLILNLVHTFKNKSQWIIFSSFLLIVALRNFLNLSLTPLRIF